MGLEEEGERALGCVNVESSRVRLLHLLCRNWPCHNPGPCYNVEQAYNGTPTFSSFFHHCKIFSPTSINAPLILSHSFSPPLPAAQLLTATLTAPFPSHAVVDDT